MTLAKGNFGEEFAEALDIKLKEKNEEYTL
jgi:hypothetical protein